MRSAGLYSSFVWGTLSMSCIHSKQPIVRNVQVHRAFVKIPTLRDVGCQRIPRVAIGVVHESNRRRIRPRFGEFCRKLALRCVQRVRIPKVEEFEPQQSASRRWERSFERSVTGVILTRPDYRSHIRHYYLAVCSSAGPVLCSNACQLWWKS